jgi:gamma-glutamyltranspeptidase
LVFSGFPRKSLDLPTPLQNSGQKIPNAIFEVLTQSIGLGASMDDVVATPRLHTEGNLDLTLERQWPQNEGEFLKTLGYTVTTGGSALVSAVSFNAKTGDCRGASR